MEDERVVDESSLLVSRDIEPRSRAETGAGPEGAVSLLAKPGVAEPPFLFGMCLEIGS